MLTDALDNEQNAGRILLVDDQPLNIRALNEVFRNDYDILMATSGEKALQQARQSCPDIILLDVVMPGISGHEVCKILKSDPDTRDIPVIFVTSHDDAQEEAYGFELGAVDFISKPINPVVVKARVKTHLALKRQSDLLRDMALMDGLTGVANRRRFDEELERSWRLCLRENRPISVLMLDVDYFKRYNDHYGHQAGDECLRQIAEALRSVLRRPNDLFARYGGEEFVGLLPFTDVEGARSRAQRMLDKVASLEIEHVESEVADRVSISIGVATCVPQQEPDAEELIRAADAALYQSKQHGRARFTEFDASTMEPAQGM